MSWGEHLDTGELDKLRTLRKKWIKVKKKWPRMWKDMVGGSPFQFSVRWHSALLPPADSECARNESLEDSGRKCWTTPWQNLVPSQLGVTGIKNDTLNKSWLKMKVCVEVWHHWNIDSNNYPYNTKSGTFPTVCQTTWNQNDKLIWFKI